MRISLRRKGLISEDLAKQAERMLRKGKPDSAVADKFSEAHDSVIADALASPIPQDRRAMLSKALYYATESAYHFERAARSIAVNRSRSKAGTPESEAEAAVLLGERARYFESAAEMLKKALPLAGSINGVEMQGRINDLQGNARVARREIDAISARFEAGVFSENMQFREVRRKQA